MARTEGEQTFRRLLLNSLVGGVTATFLWFAITFWAYLETGSVLVTSVISGAFGLANAVVGLLFGTYVDTHRKHRAMVVSTASTLGCFVAAIGAYIALDPGGRIGLRDIWLWALIAVVMAGSVVGNLRTIAMSTCVSLLVPEGRREQANGMVGTVTGISFAVTSVFSGLVVGQLGMGWAIGIATVLTAGSLLHLRTIRFDEPDPAPPADGTTHQRFDLAGAMEAVRAVPGLGALIVFAAFNNLLGGVYMSLLDAYGLELVSVEVWGLLWGVLSLGFIVGGLVVAKRGLGGRPLGVVFLGNLVSWAVASVFALGASIWIVGIGMMVWLTIMPIIEAAEQTVLQRAVPFERQGRVFGFAQAIESAASPMVALAIGPFAQEVTIPFMTTGSGRDLFDGLFGNGVTAGIGICFTAAGLIGFVMTAAARTTKPYRQLDGTTRAPAAG